MLRLFPKHRSHYNVQLITFQALHNLNTQICATYTEVAVRNFPLGRYNYVMLDSKGAKMLIGYGRRTVHTLRWIRIRLDAMAK